MSVTLASICPSSYTSALQAAQSVQTTAPNLHFAGAQVDENDEAAVVTISAQAQAAMSAQSASTTYYAQFFPTRLGTKATALANGVTNPQAETSSAGLSLSQVATSARASLNAGYSAMSASGQPFNYDSKDGVDEDTLMGNLDRRSLYAISSNTGGLFTTQEQGIAQSLMSSQLGLASGFYNGPVDKQQDYVDPSKGDLATKTQLEAKFLDSVSLDEQTSIPWAMNRASLQITYAAATQGSSQAAPNITSTNPIVELFTSALNTMQGNPSRAHTYGPINNAQDLDRQPWFQGFETQLQPAIDQAKALYRVT